MFPTSQPDNNQTEKVKSNHHQAQPGDKLISNLGEAIRRFVQQRVDEPLPILPAKYRM